MHLFRIYVFLICVLDPTNRTLFLFFYPLEAYKDLVTFELCVQEFASAATLAYSCGCSVDSLLSEAKASDLQNISKNVRRVSVD